MESSRKKNQKLKLNGFKIKPIFVGFENSVFLFCSEREEPTLGEGSKTRNQNQSI